MSGSRAQVLVVWSAAAEVARPAKQCVGAGQGKFVVLHRSKYLGTVFLEQRLYFEHTLAGPEEQYPAQSGIDQYTF